MTTFLIIFLVLCIIILLLWVIKLKSDIKAEKENNDYNKSLYDEEISVLANELKTQTNISKGLTVISSSGGGCSSEGCGSKQ
tara:strand:+ start:14078 stop:14323 length:246 start_codon:yes stop_codon:yes gene_type:complete